MFLHQGVTFPSSFPNLPLFFFQHGMFQDLSPQSRSMPAPNPKHGALKSRETWHESLSTPTSPAS